MRKIGAAALAVVAVALMVMAIPSAITALRARGAVVSSCDYSLAALPFGTWVRLKDCGVDMFHTSFLDAGAVRTHRLVVLRASDDSAAEPGRLALAIDAIAATDPAVFKTTARTDSAISRVADLGDTVGVIWTNLDRAKATHSLVTVDGIETGLVPSPILIELRQVPALRPSAGFVLAGLVALGLAVVVWRYQPSTRVRHSPAPVAPAGPGVRWGLVFVAVLVGMVALGRGIQWYFDPMQPRPQEVPAPRPQPTRAAGSARPVLPDPTPGEIVDLSSSDPVTQVQAATVLLGRAETPGLVAAVEAALQRMPTAPVEAQLICLKVRFKGPEHFEFLLDRFPKDRTAFLYGMKAEVNCMLDAMVARAAEAPERVRDALMPAIYASNPGTAGKALRAFRTMDLPQIPTMLLAEASTSGSRYRREALRAALALGATRLNPAVVAGALRDRNTSDIVTSELRTSPHANAARIVAQVWAERSAESAAGRLAREREAQMHDVSAALLEIVLDPAEPEGKRAAGAHQLTLLADTGPLHALRALSPTLESGRLKTSVDSAIGVLEDHLKSGGRAQMRALPPKAAGRS